MKKIIFGTIFSVFALALVVVPSFAYTFPSTNELNKNGQNPIRSGIGPHVNVVSTGVGEVTLEFVMPQTYLGCFEYRSDGEPSQYGNIYPHPVIIGDFYYHYKCINNTTFTKTFYADEYVEVRSAFGGERDWDFDWTRFNVLPEPADTTLPSTPVITGFNNPTLACGGSTNSHTATVDWTDSTDASGIAGYEYYVDYPLADGSGRGIWNPSSLWTTSENYGSLNEGVHHIKVRAKDNAGNYSEWSNVCDITADWTNPDLTFSGFRDQNSATYDNTKAIRSCGSVNSSGFIAWEWTLNNAEANPVNYLYKILSGPTAVGYSANTANTYYNGQIPMTGLYTVQVTGTDAAGNVSIPVTCSVDYELAPILIGPPINKDQCKNNGWKIFNNPIFKNQGACVSYVVSNENAGKRN